MPSDETWGKLIELEPKLRRLCKRVAPYSRREDRLQLLDDLWDVCVDVVPSIIERYNDHGTLDGWIFHCTRMYLLQSMRYRPADTLENSSEFVEAIHDSGVESHTTITDGLLSLHPYDAWLLKVRNIDGLTFDEMAIQAGVHVQTIKRHYDKAVEFARESI